MSDARPEGPERADLPEVLDASAIARLFGVCPRVAARWLTEGRLPSRRVGKRRYVLRSELLKALQPE